jgi:hypothetical protein
MMVRRLARGTSTTGLVAVRVTVIAAEAPTPKVPKLATSALPLTEELHVLGVADTNLAPFCRINACLFRKLETFIVSSTIEIHYVHFSGPELGSSGQIASLKFFII